MSEAADHNFKKFFNQAVASIIASEQCETYLTRLGDPRLGAVGRAEIEASIKATHEDLQSALEAMQSLA